MTKLLAQAMEKAAALPDEEQDRIAARILKEMTLEERGEAAEPYASFRFLREANLDLPPDASVTYERELYGRTADLDD